MTPTFRAALAATAALVALPAGALAQDGLAIEVRPSGPPAWLDPPNVAIPGNLEGSMRRLVYEQMVLSTPSALESKRGIYPKESLLPRRRELGTLPPTIEFE